ncbi:MAG: immune inhibitor A [Chloroflexota bacterium]|nr:immune inhibitor A [Chloroflexota bacterium]
MADRSRALLASTAALALALAAACAPHPTLPALTSEPTPTLAAIAADISKPPAADHFDLVRRYLGVEADPLPPERLYRDEALGRHETFTLLDVVAMEPYQVRATLRSVGEHAFWYVEDGLDVEDDALARAAERYDETIHPGVFRLTAPDQSFPGRLTIVAARLRGGVGGYVTGLNALPTTVYPHSNERAMLVMNLGAPIDGAQFAGTLAHELQHAVHGLADDTEEGWLNEGLSEYSVRALNLRAFPFSPYLDSSEVSLTDWPLTLSGAAPNYAAASLFFTYLASRLGGDAPLAGLSADQRDGVESVDALIRRELPGTGFDDLFGDWIASNVAEAAEGRFANPFAARNAYVERWLDGPGEATGRAPQFGAWYLGVDAPQPLDVVFEGRTRTPIIPEPPPEGDFCWWGNAADGASARLTREFDLTGLARATLHFSHWHEIEEGWDYAYVSASRDGEHWEALPATGATARNPLGIALGPAYTGASGGWTEAEASLDDYAGEKALVRFEYVTDESTHGAGWCIDAIELAEIGFADGAEDNLGGWTAEGFVRISQGGVAQPYVLRVVSGQGAGLEVREIEVDADGRAAFRVEGRTIIAVSGLARHTRQPAEFTLRLTALPDAPT